MEQLKSSWLFDVPPESSVVTSSYVTRKGLPILEVSHEDDEEDGALWQFHCGNGDLDSAVLQLVRLDGILRLDPGLVEVATLPLGFQATRASRAAPWVFAPAER